MSFCAPRWTMAQGKIGFNTDTLHLVYYDATVPELGGSAVSSSNMPPGVTLMADLYMGTSSSTLYLYSSATFSTTAGRWNSVSVVANTNPVTGAPTIFGQAYIVTQVRDGSLTPPSIWTPTTSPFGNYYGVSQEFTLCVCGGITYPPMWGASGTWAAGTFPLDQYGAGFKGAIAVSSPVGLPQFCCGRKHRHSFRIEQPGGRLPVAVQRHQHPGCFDFVSHPEQRAAYQCRQLSAFRNEQLRLWSEHDCRAPGASAQRPEHQDQ
jgi:hypothetical protein